MPQTLIVEDKFAAWLAAVPAVAARAGGRVFPWALAPQAGPFPYLLYHRVGFRRHGSTRGKTTRLAVYRLQVDVVARVYADAREVAEAVQLAIEGPAVGQLHMGTLDGYLVQSARVRDCRDYSADPAHGDAVPEPRVMLDTELWVEEVK